MLGLKVLDFGTALAGPYITTLLADMGADVIKIEKPGRGDLIRFTDRHVEGLSGYFLGINRGKSSMTLDIRTPEGQELARRLAADVDVVVENFRCGRMDVWNLGYRRLAQDNPGLVYCSVSGYGDIPGYETAAGNDIVAQGVSGMMSVTGEANGPPVKSGAPVVDVAAAMLGTIGVLGALLDRATTGRGRHVEVSLLESAYALMPNFTTSTIAGTVEFHRLGSGHPQLVPYQAFECADGDSLIVGAFHRESWATLCRCLGRPDLLTDERFTENWDRIAARDELVPILAAEMAKRTRNDWLEIFRINDLPAAPVFTIKESIAHFAERLPELLVRHPHGKLGSLTELRSPIRFSDAPGGISDETPREAEAAPVLGGDTERILGGLGLDAAEIAALRRNKVV